MGVLRFQLFGFPIAVLPGYWLLSAVMGLGSASHSVAAGVQLVGVLFASILVHELGHAFAARAFGMRAQITLHMMGGGTAFVGDARLTRGRDILISLAGPLAGLLLSAAAWLAYRAHSQQPLLTTLTSQPGEVSALTSVLVTLAFLNGVWSLLNLMPVIPFDGGRVLAAALGPKRRQLAGSVSLGVGLLLAAVLLKIGSWFAAALFAAAAVSSFLRFKAAPSARPDVDEATLKQALRAAEEALRTQAFTQATQLAQAVVGASANPELTQRALQTLLWARLGAGDAAGARALLLAAPAGSVEAYLSAAVLEAAGELEQAERYLGLAREAGDTRVEVAALLVKVLLGRRKFSQAAALTLEILQGIQPLEARRVAAEAKQGGAQAEAALLSLAIAKAESTLTDAVDALFGFALTGKISEAREAFALALAIDASSARRLLDDERLHGLRPRLEAP
jgi:Zn-dependent protease